MSEDSELTLMPCPFWNSYMICPLRKRMYGIPPPERFKPVAGLKFPIKCRFATIYRCVWVKDYYMYSEPEEVEE